MSISSSTSSNLGIPPVGGVRCYWALLAPKYPNPNDPKSQLELQFVHFDPILTVHLARQKMSMMGRGVIEFIHPAEREQARNDLTSAIQADDLQGSVTRVRFARVSAIRRILGCPPEENNVPNLESIAEDDQYIIVDVVLNWVADGVLLAFFHAIKDKDAAVNNDPSRRHEEWSNFCGTPDMPDEQIQALHQAVTAHVPPPVRTRHPPTRVFQLHTNSSSTSHPNALVFSWPPPRQPPAGGGAIINTNANGGPLFDGFYDAEEYADLMRGVDMDPNQLATIPGEVRTNCTTRFGAEHSIRSEGVYRHVQSVFIPYGSLIFACFQTTKLYELPSSTPRSPDAYSLPPPAASSTPGKGHSGGVRGGNGGSGSASASNDQWSPSPVSASASASASISHRDWRQDEYEDGPYRVEHGYPTPTTTGPYGHPAADGYPPPPPLQHLHAHQHHPPQPVLQHVHAPPPPPPPQQQQHSSYYAHDGYHGPPRHGAPGPTNSLSLSHSHSHSLSHSHSHPHPHAHAAHNHGGHQIDHSTTPPRPNLGSQNHGNGSSQSAASAASSRPLVRPPGDVDKCRGCGTRESPEWRKGENGVKDLCNACGLKLARAVAKREGRQKPRKKKDK